MIFRRICKNYPLSRDFFIFYKEHLDWDYICTFQHLNEDIIIEFRKYINWERIKDHQKISKEFRNRFYLDTSENCFLYKTKEEKINYIYSHLNIKPDNCEYIYGYLVSNISKIYNNLNYLFCCNDLGMKSPKKYKIKLDYIIYWYSGNSFLVRGSGIEFIFS